jgi:hypothetical protein
VNKLATASNTRRTGSPVRALADRNASFGPHLGIRGRDTLADPVSLVRDVLGSSSGHTLDGATQATMQSRLGPTLAGASVRSADLGNLQLGARSDPREREAERAASATPAPDTVTSSRGHFDFSQIRIHSGPEAARSAQALGTPAYSVGPNIVFGAGQESATPFGHRVLAHEIAHVVQHGRSNEAGATIRCFTEFTTAQQSSGSADGWLHPSGSDLRVADDGQMAVEDNGWGAGLSKRAWTTPAQVAAANSILSSQGSVAQLAAKSGGMPLHGTAPVTRQTTTLQEIEPIKSSGGGDFDLASDCGTAARQVMGSGPQGIKDAAVVKKGAGGQDGTAGGLIGGAIGLLGGGAIGASIGYAAGGSNRGVGALIGGAIGAVAGLVGGIIAGAAIQKANQPKTQPGEETLTPRTYHGGHPTTPEEWSEELFKKEFGQNLTREEAYAAYARLSSEEKDAFDRKYGINKYAVPRVGQGVTISTEKDMPGFATSSAFTWNFHYAAAVLASGEDYVTLESAAGWAPTDWIFFMYGPEKKGQSFYEFQASTDTHGTKSSSYVVEPAR